MAPAPGLRAIRKARTHADIVRVATAMFTQRGYDEVTVEDIVAEVEVSHRTFYRYFASKEELVFGPLQQGLERFVNVFRARPLDEPVTVSVRAALLDFAANLEATRYRLLPELVRETPSLRQRQLERRVAYEKVMVPLIAERLGVDPVSDILPALIAGCAVAAVNAAVAQWLLNEPPNPLLPVVEQALTMATSSFERALHENAHR